MLLDEDRVEISGSSAVHEKRIVKKILKAGHPEESAFRFGASRTKKILAIEGRAVYPDGREKTISSDDISIVPDLEEFVLYSDQKSHSFRFPGAAAGTVIEVRVTWKIENLVHWEPAVFQREIPILTRRYTLVHPRGLDFAVHASLMPDAPSSEADLGGGKHMLVWERNNIDSFRYGELMPPAAELLPSLWFSVRTDAELGVPMKLDSWSGVADWYREISRESLEPGRRLRSMMDTLRSDGTSERETAARIFAWVQANLRYVAIYLGDDGYRPHEIEDILANRYGDCKDKSVVLVTALREAGIEASLVLVRTADLGSIQDMFPTPYYFNHAIVAAMVEEGTVFLDPTCETCSFGILPEMDQGAEALVIGDAEEGLTILPFDRPRPNRSAVSMEATISSEGDARTTITIEMDGYLAAAARRMLTHRAERSRLEVVTAILSGIMPAVRVEEGLITGEDPASDLLTIAVTGTVPGMLDVGTPYPFVRVVLDRMTTGLPDCADRIYPIDLGTPRSLEYEIRVVLPEEWLVRDAPPSGAIHGASFDYSYLWSIDGRTVRFSRKWSNASCRTPTADCAELRSQLEAVRDVEESRILARRK